MMKRMSDDATHALHPAARPPSGPHITEGRAAAPSSRAQLHRPAGKNVPAPRGGYLLAPGATGEAR